MSRQYFLHFKWTVSRGRDTYGYNICTLYVDGVQAGKCNGGGYDMQGTSLAQWLQEAFQERLQKLFRREIKNVKPSDWRENTENGKPFRYLYLSEPFRNNFYGAHLSSNKDKIVVRLDGSCGFSSIERIAKAIGVVLQWQKASDRSKNDSYYIATVSYKMPTRR